jgi:hypothetical protein
LTLIWIRQRELNAGTIGATSKPTGLETDVTVDKRVITLAGPLFQYDVCYGCGFVSFATRSPSRQGSIASNDLSLASASFAASTADRSG